MKNKIFIICITMLFICVINTSAQTCQPTLPQNSINTTYIAPPGSTITVNSGDNLQNAINQAVPGDVIVIQAGATFTGNFSLPNKSGNGWVYITSSAASNFPIGKRVSTSDATNMPKILAAGTSPAFSCASAAHHYRLIGLEIGTTANDNYEVVTLGSSTSNIANLPNNLIIDRCYIHGNNTGNLKVGVSLNTGAAAIIDSRIENIHAESGVSTFEAKAISCYNGTGPFKIHNNYLEASHITILFGGATASITNLVPSDAEITCNHMTKKTTWNPADPNFAGTTWGVKNLFEIKNGQRMLLEGNTLENCWPSDPNVAGGPQSGWAILLTVRDEGNMPWATVSDVIFKNNIIRHSNAGIQIYGSEGSGAHRIQLENNLFDDIGGANWGANDKTGRICQGTDADDICFNHNTLLHTANNIIMNYGSPAMSNVTFSNNLVNYYDGMSGLTLSTFTGNAFIGGGSSAGYPPGNYFPSNVSAVQFVDYNNGDYHLSANSAYNNAGSDRKDIGEDIDILNNTVNACDNVATGIIQSITNEKSWIVYPNPARTVLNILFENNNASTIILSDILGNELSNKQVNNNNLRLDIQNLPSGMYFITVKTNKSLYTKRVMIAND